jgi:hypothetical protein
MFEIMYRCDACDATTLRTVKVLAGELGNRPRCRGAMTNSQSVFAGSPGRAGENSEAHAGLDEQRSLIASDHCQAYGDSAAAHPGNKGEQDDCEHDRDPPSERGSKYSARAVHAPMTY